MQETRTIPTREVHDAIPPIVLAIDAGTSSARALLFDSQGRQLRDIEARITYEAATSTAGAFTLDPTELTSAVAHCIDGVLTQIASLHCRISAVVIDTFWHNLIALDHTGTPLTPVLTWADTRSTTVIPLLRQQLDERAVHQRTGCIFHSSYWPAKLAWLQRTQPHIAIQAARYVSIGEYLVWQFCGAWQCSVSMASGTGIFDQNRRTWDPELLQLLHIHPEQLAPLGSGRSPAGSITSPYTQRWPALKDVPWFPATGDGACSNAGSGCTERNRVALMIGTSGAMRMCFQASTVQIPWGLWCYHLTPDYFLLGGALSNGGLLWDWMMRTFRLENNAVEKALQQIEPDSHRLTILPFLAGERSPNWNGNARAAFAGVGITTEPIHFLRAGLEAVSYRFALIYELLHPILPADTQIIASGGAILHSPLWVQMLADVLGTSVTVSAEPEATSRGAAILGLWGLHAIASPGDSTVSPQLGSCWV
ncbi:MAG: gluconokinase, partial [Chloroflexi bacterium]|nr:gluconokinase [Chloroflexota bacterium]